MTAAIYIDGVYTGNVIHERAMDVAKAQVRMAGWVGYWTVDEDCLRVTTDPRFTTSAQRRWLEERRKAAPRPSGKVR